MAEKLKGDFTIQYTYQRSVGPVLGGFFTALKERRLEGVRLEGGKVICPPREYDPETGQAAHELVPVGPTGTVTSWAWVQAPLQQHPLSSPFAWALIRPDGADTALLHVVRAQNKDMKTGMRVVPSWREETQGSILDIECFIPEEGTS